MVDRSRGRIRLVEELYEMELNLVVHAAEEEGLVSFEETYPEGWTEVHLTWKGEDFLAEWGRLATEVDPEPVPDPFDLTEAVASGESDSTEFKSTLRINLHTGQPDTRIELAVLKTLAGFLNARGGSLIIGVADDGTPVGIEADRFANEDRMSQHLVNLVRGRISAGALPDIHPHFEDLEETRVLVVRCSPAANPMHVKDGSEHRFYIRSGPTTQELPAPEAVRYIGRRFGG